MSSFPLSTEQIEAFVTMVLDEDMGAGGDITSRLTIPPDARLRAVMDSRDAITVAGLPLAEAFFRRCDPRCAIRTLARDGDQVPAGQDLMVITGQARALLTAERSALNTVQHLSGVATLTRRYVDAIVGTGAVLLDTRKTIPGLRLLEKYATVMGGARNHRMRLDDGILIKDNHIAIVGSVTDAVRAAKAGNSGLAVQVECDRLDQVVEALAAGADRLLLDNMTPADLRACLDVIAGRVPVEASGGVTLATIRAIAETGVDFISVGRITQSAPAADIGLDYVAA